MIPQETTTSPPLKSRIPAHAATCSSIHSNMQRLEEIDVLGVEPGLDRAVRPSRQTEWLSLPVLDRDCGVEYQEHVVAAGVDIADHLGNLSRLGERFVNRRGVQIRMAQPSRGHHALGHCRDSGHVVLETLIEGA